MISYRPPAAAATDLFVMKMSYSTARAVAISAFLLLLLAGGAAAQTPAAAKLSNEEIAAKIDEYMDAAVKVNGFSGSVLAARDGKPIVSKGYQMANIELRVPNSPDSVFRLGSITKQFTGMAIAMLEERGKLKAEDGVCVYVSPCPDAWKPITIFNLLTHTSGIPNYTSFPDFAKTTILPVTTGEMMSVLVTKPLDFKPGEKYAYSNSGYYVLGVIIEKVSGQKYADFLTENIFGPLGLKHTGYDDPRAIIMGRASGYQRVAGKVFNADYMDLSVPYAAGALYSTTGDLLIWDQALYGEKLVSKKTLDRIFTPGKNGYGWGWGISTARGRKEISLGGGIYGFATEISRYPDDKVTVIVLSNFQGAPAGRVASDIAAIIFGTKYEIPKKRTAIELSETALRSFIGDYKIDQMPVVINVMFENGGLVGQIVGQAIFSLLPESDSKFFSNDVNLSITFARDGAGAVTGLTLQQGGATFKATKVK